ncbi:hypothetical protein M378DRAFT_176734 [Amanita muscaria Koide BX008]|uniref:Uncharacterized protein n=1 Tax=Amanita muscaria (strain Koide BX008) TaxID=946122 RepID=A0A0C2TN39_AMAMK|nr:hypothetical protein M378DRAFT_176734 [Amanita muscaria Koide BX008]
MNPFRGKKSDSQESSFPFSSQVAPHQEKHPTTVLPELPQASDFRTSLILKDLSKRFSVLRLQTGEPVTVRDLKHKFAEQRRRGARNQITEEEEVMLLETLGRMRSKTTPSGKSQDIIVNESAEHYPDRSTSPVNSSIHASPTSSPSGKATKRYSNNLFGSGRLRDYTYFRNAGSNLGRASSTRVSSMTPTETSISIQEISSLHDGLQTLMSETSSMKSGLDSKLTNPFILMSAADEQMVESSPAIDKLVLKRASNAFADAIKELEEETEDEVVLPRLNRPSLDSGPRQPESVADGALSSQSSLHSPAVVETGTAISSDKQVITHSDPRASPVHPRSLPGYIPGMPRPMTPRDLDLDEQRSISTTPRAMSPLPVDVASSVVSRHLSSVSASLGSVSPQPSSPPPTTTTFRPSTPSRSTPLFLQRSPSGRRTPDNGPTSGDVIEFDHPLNSSIISSRRAASPSTASVSNHIPTMLSRPTTPSNLVWKQNGHERNGSWLSDSAMSDSQSLDMQSSVSRHAVSPLPDSTMLDQVFGGDSSSNISGSTRVTRSPTPSHNSPRSVAFPNIDISPRNGSKRSSRQNTASPFLFGQYAPLVLLPVVSSSRSSLESIGSSYHSWEGEKDRCLNVFSDSDDQLPAWHDIRVERANSVMSGEFADDDEWDPEEIIGRYTALKTSDFKAMQEKLVSLSTARDEVRERAPSIRRRRPSTSQSNYSVNGRDRIASPQPASPTATSSEQISTVLGAAAGNILSRPPDVIDTSVQRVSSEPSPNTRRNRDLAQALFGDDLEKERESTPKPSYLHITKEPRSVAPEALNGADIENTNSTEKFASFRLLSPYPNIPSTIQEADLAREVQEKVEAATFALRKNPPNNEPRIERSILGSISRRRINPSQISEPRLVSASTSVDAVPIRPNPVSNSGTSKIGSRFRKLRGSLRSKNPAAANGDAAQVQTEASQSVNYDLSKPVANATENGRSKAAVASESAPTSPGLKGFMARFRSKRGVDNATLDRRGAPQVSPSVVSLATSQADRTTLPSSIANDSVGPSSGSSLLHVSEQIRSSQETAPTSLDSNTAALRQLFDAASNLGLDQNALNALIASSSSVPRPATRSGISAVAGQTEGSKRDQPMILTSENGWTWPPSSCEGEVDPKHETSNPPEAVDRLPSETRKSEDGLSENVPNAIVRRTIIYPSDSPIPSDPNSLAKKGSHRRRASVQSTSSRSIQDRVPTPPPPRSPTSKSFANGPSPPVPQLPHSLLSNAELYKTSAYVPRHSFEKSTSAYDSLYEMYGEELASATGKEFSTSSKPFLNSNPDAPALELIELANGETIWSIVNGLRDEDNESAYAGRTSFGSEFSTREGNSDGLQVHVKDHRKTGSKGSNSSFASRRRIVQGKNRPETKVYYSTSTQIGRLIENLSQGMDSGSFKFSSNPPQTGHSASSSLSLQPSTNDAHWTVEERLEHMLESIAKG